MTTEAFNAESAREYTRLFNAIEGSRYMSIARKYWRDYSNDKGYQSWHLCPRVFDPVIPPAHHFDSDLPPTPGPWCPYQSNREKHFYLRMHRKIAARLKRGTTFQKWLERQPEYEEALELLSKKKLQQQVWTAHEAPLLSGCGSIYTVWYFQFMIASALLAYYNYIDYPQELKKRYPSAIPNYTKKEKKLAGDLLASFRERGAGPGPQTLYSLQLIAASDTYVPHMKGGSEELSITRRRRLFVEELAIRGRGKLFSARGETNRFPADVVAICCRLVNYSQANVRNVVGSMKKLEESGETSPLTHHERIEGLPKDGFYQ